MISKTKKNLIALLANFVFLFHCFVIFIILFGWTFGKLSILYPITLIITLILESILGYCILARIEFNLRKKIKPDLDYDSSFISYYLYRIYNFKISRAFMDTVYVLFLIISLCIYYYSTFMIK